MTKFTTNIRSIMGEGGVLGGTLSHTPGDVDVMTREFGTISTIHPNGIDYSDRTGRCGDVGATLQMDCG